jgi:hypothetical protein
MFPLSIRGKIQVDPESLADGGTTQIVNDIVSGLQNVHAINVRESDGSIEFSSHPFRPIGRWNIIAPIDHGRISIHKDSFGVYVYYNVRLLITTTIGILFGLLFLYMSFRSDIDDWREHVLKVTLPPVLLCVWLVGLNYIICAIRFPGWLRRQLKFRESGSTSA